MTETRGTYTTDDSVYCEAITRLGVERLSQILKALDDIREDTGYGAVDIRIQDGHVFMITKRVDYK